MLATAISPHENSNSVEIRVFLLDEISAVIR